MLDLVKFISDQSLGSEHYLYQPMLERLSGEKITVSTASTKLGELKQNADLQNNNDKDNNFIFDAEKSLKKL